jgi:amidase
MSGFPHITLPGGWLYGLPVGISFFGRPWSEQTLINIALVYEEASKKRKKPEFVKAFLH